MSSPRMSLLVAVGAGALGAAGVSADAWPGVRMLQIAAQRAAANAGEITVDSPRTTPAPASQSEAPVLVMSPGAQPPTLRDPSSFVRVRITPAQPGAANPEEAQASARFSPPALAEPAGEQTAEVQGLIPVPDNARAGDPAFVEVAQEEPDAQYGYFYDDAGPPYGPYGTVRHYHPYFIDGWTPGHSGRHPVPHSGRSRQDRDAHAFGSDDLHRRAELLFSQAAMAAPGVARTEAGFAQAQLQFSRAALAPGVARQGDGLRHEVVRPAPRPQR